MMAENLRKRFCMICGEIMAEDKSICSLCKEKIEKESRKGKEKVKKESDKELKKQGIPSDHSR